MALEEVCLDSCIYTKLGEDNEYCFKDANIPGTTECSVCHRNVCPKLKIYFRSSQPNLLQPTQQLLPLLKTSPMKRMHWKRTCRRTKRSSPLLKLRRKLQPPWMPRLTALRPKLSSSPRRATIQQTLTKELEDKQQPLALKLEPSWTR